MDFKKLPQYDPDPDLWSRVEAELNADAAIDKTLDSLPQHEPANHLWTRIADDLHETRVVPIGQTAIRVFWINRWTAIAAAIVLVVAGWWLWQAGSTSDVERVTIAYSTETATKKAYKITAPAVDERAEEFIAKQCVEQRQACQRPEVHELRNQLVEVKEQRARIEQEMDQFGDDPVLARAQSKVQSQRAEVTRELIALLQS